MTIIDDWNSIPRFANEEEEAAYWETHSLAGTLMAGSVHEADTRESTTITLRFDPRMLSRIKRIARERYLNYQPMMKQWLSERIEEEQRKRN